ncbi:MAG: tryptophan halogenase family protein [Bacteroidota bacterium]
MSRTTERVEKIIVVGGGSAGWMSAAYLMKATNFQTTVQLIESPNIPRIGVGEATLPSIKEQLFDFLEIPEEVWMPKCNATYKMGIKFVNWRLSPEQGGDKYYHIFGEMPSLEGFPLSQIWYDLKRQGLDKPLDYACHTSPYLCDNFKSPKYLDGKSAVHAAYHFDASLIADFLKNWCLEKGVSYIQDDLLSAEQAENGDIEYVIGAEGDKYAADLFIDCTGFRGFLIDEVLNEPKISFSKSLLNNSAVAINVPNNGDTDIPPYTSATAMTTGWTWETPLKDRKGNGYVYSNDFQSAEDAEKELRQLLGPKSDGINARHVKFESARRRRSWVNNCVSIGLASSFLEPLESTGLYFVYAALYQLAEHFPTKSMSPALRDKFNAKISYMVDDVRDFIVLHFCTSPREDTAYWRANKYDLEISDSLQGILDLQKAGIPIKRTYRSNEALYTSFEAAFDRFWTNSNYQSILAGVDYMPEMTTPMLNYYPDIFGRAQDVISQVEAESKELMDKLPSHYEYLETLAKPALQGT